MATLEDLQKLEIKIGRVKSVEKVEGADRLLRFVFDLGGAERQILSGIAEFYPDPSVLLGKELPIVTNLEPRTIRGLESQGMVLVVIDQGRAVCLHPEKEVAPGSEVR